MSANLNCPNCGERVPENRFNSGHPARCPACLSQLEIYIFPAFHTDLSPPQIRLAHESETVCFFHARYRAMAPCDHCGRFLCEICAIAVGNRQLCAECLSGQRKQRNETGLVHHAPLFDNVALVLVALPTVTVIFGFLTILSAPVSLLLSFYYWSRQWNLLPRSRFRFALASMLAILLLLGWASLIYYAMTIRR
jgi:hypothetical protein